jgi:predicted MPP superfamily phosphohydrolase
MDSPPSTNAPPRPSRRRWLKRAAAGLAGLAVCGGGYSLLEAGWLSIGLRDIAVPELPPAFDGLRVGFASDLHHGPYTGLPYLRNALERLLALKPDVLLLGGDFVHQDPQFIAPVCEMMGDCIKNAPPPLGTFAVLGNHDHWESAKQTRAGLRAAQIVELLNAAQPFSRQGQKLWLCGVGDLWEREADPEAAAAMLPAQSCALLLSHNPDVAEQLDDPRFKLVLSGHTHGGQVRLPLFGAPMVPSRYGQKYLQGLCQAPLTQVFVSRGAGTISPPVRFNCRPEVHVLTLRARPETA